MVRKADGSGIVEGTVGLMLVIGGGVMASLFLLNCGMSAYFKQKLEIVSNAAAQYAATLPPSDDLPTKTTLTQQFVQQLMPQVGVRSINLSVNLDNSTVGTQTGISATVTNCFPLFGNGSILPATIQLSDSSWATTSGNGSGGGSSWNGPWFAFYFSYASTGQPMTIYVPCSNTVSAGLSTTGPGPILGWSDLGNNGMLNPLYKGVSFN
jgi:hypothetical protein